MDYEFKNIELLIRNAISSTKSKTPFKEQFAIIRKAVAEEKARAKECFAMQAISFENEPQVKRYVQYHQSQLTSLIDELFTLSKSGKVIGSPIESEAFFLYDQLEEILDFIQVEFPIYFNQEGRLTEPRKNSFKKNYSKSLESLRTLLAIEIIDPDLAGLLLNYLKGTLSGTLISFRRASLLESLTNSLLRLKDTVPPEKLTIEIRCLLLAMNFNSPEFFKYYTNLIRQSLSELDSEVDKLEKLALHLKTVNQNQPQTGSSFDSNSASIKGQLSNWLLEEIQFLQSTQQALFHGKPDEFIKNDFKIEFDMSVSQFAFFTRAFVESGVIQNKNVTEVIRFFSKFVKTKRSGSISQESLRIKYYDVEDSTKDAVRNTLHTAIGYINSNK